MVDVAAIAQGAQVGAEATPGTAAAAGTILDSISITTGFPGQNDTFRPDGHKYPSLTLPGKEWMSAAYDGKLTYSDFVYILSSAIRWTTPANTGSTGKVWTVAPQNAAEDTHLTFTVEKGGSVRAHRFAYGMFSSINIDVTRDECNISGEMFGRRIEDGVTLTATPTAVELDPVLPRNFSVFLDTTAAGLGTTRLLRTFQGQINLGNLVAPVWPINALVPSFDTHVEVEPQQSVVMFVEHDAAGAEFITLLRSGDTRFLRLSATGEAAFEAGTPGIFKSWIFDGAVKVKSIGDHEDREGIYGYSVTLDLVNDDDWGKPYEFTVTNRIATIVGA